VVVCDENGLAVFGGCAASVTGRVSSSTPSTYLEVDGTDLRREPIEVRKATVASLFRLASRYVSGRSKDWLKFKNPEAPVRGGRGLGPVRVLMQVADRVGREATFPWGWLWRLKSPAADNVAATREAQR
jgi:hypothetical protein